MKKKMEGISRRSLFKVGAGLAAAGGLAAPRSAEARLEMIPGAGHMVQLEASSEVNAILLDYLQDISQHL